MDNKTKNTGFYQKTASSRRNPLLDVGRVPPQATEVEQAVLGAMMLERSAIGEVLDILRPSSFYRDAHKHIYEAIVSLFNRSEPIDMLTVAEQLRREGKLELVGGAHTIATLTSQVSSSANIIYHARIIAEKAMRRELIHISDSLQKDAFEDGIDVFDLLDKMQQSLFDISEANIKRKFSDMQSIISATLKELEYKSKQKDGLVGVPSGFSALDRVTLGWQKSDLIIIAARPAMGKTSFVLSAVRNAAVEFGKPAAMFSLEMSSVQLVTRLLASETEIDSKKLRNGKLTPEDWEQLMNKINYLSEAKIFIDDTPAISLLELRAKCRRLKSQHDIQLIVIDYLQLMSAEGTLRNGGSREQEIATISRGLKQIAKELDVPVIALSQLSRAVETRGGDKRPILSDLRESGSIEQDADQVFFLYRPEYYGITEDDSGNPTQGIAEVLIAKNRHGETKNISLRFIEHLTRFSDLDMPLQTYSGGGSSQNYQSVDSFDNNDDDFDATMVTFESKMNSSSDKTDSPPDAAGNFEYDNSIPDDEPPF
ncbi:MAG: replicative DNA helicase [Bernardetiaceae bacterium]|nr:replicative DNA helicase [Bernardetiaceae bacterium]